MYLVKEVINIANMLKCTHSRNLKIISQSWNINPRVATWAAEQHSIVWGRDGQGHLSLCSTIWSTSVLHDTRGIAYAAGHFIHSLQTPSTTLQFSAAVCHQIWTKRLLWNLCWSESRSICQSALFKLTLRVRVGGKLSR